MAFWNKNGSPEKNHSDHSLSIIGEGAQVEGTLDIPGNLRIEGIFLGKALVGNRLVIAESGQVHGYLQARELLIAGNFEGEIRNCQHVEITSTARVNGSIQSQKLDVQSGAILRLTCEIGDVGQLPPPPPSKVTATPSAAPASTPAPASNPPKPKSK